LYDEKFGKNGDLHPGRSPSHGISIRKSYLGLGRTLGALFFFYAVCIPFFGDTTLLLLFFFSSSSCDAMWMMNGYGIYDGWRIYCACIRYLQYIAYKSGA
jgi:hypothetical protein